MDMKSLTNVLGKELADSRAECLCLLLVVMMEDDIEQGGGTGEDGGGGAGELLSLLPVEDCGRAFGEAG